MVGRQGQTVESCTTETAVSILLFSSLLHHKKSRMEEKENRTTAPPRLIYKHGKQTLNRKHFLKKASVENLLYAIRYIIITQLKHKPS